MWTHPLDFTLLNTVYFLFNIREIILIWALSSHSEVLAMGFVFFFFFTITLISGFLDSPAVLPLHCGHSTSLYKVHTSSFESPSKGLGQDVNVTPSHSKWSLLSAQYQQLVDSIDYQKAHELYFIFTCCMFLVLSALWHKYWTTEKEKQIPTVFIPLVATAVLSRQMQPLSENGLIMLFGEACT